MSITPPSGTRKPRKRPVIAISGCECAWVIASSEADARADLLAGGYPEDTKLIDDGWAKNVGWNYWEYDTRTDFREDTGLTSWWNVGEKPPADGMETAKLRRVWRIA